jgi:hypothetical protein
MTIAQIEQHVSQLPFATVATELVANNLAFYPDETASDLTRTVALLRKLVRDGVLAGIAPARGEAGTCDIEQARLIAAQFRQARQPVEGQGILITIAAEKYGFSTSNIYDWLKKGWIRVVAMDAGNRLFNEGDLAFARTIADMVGQRPGKAIFPYRKPTGRPPKN